MKKSIVLLVLITAWGCVQQQENQWTSPREYLKSIPQKNLDYFSYDMEVPLSQRFATEKDGYIDFANEFEAHPFSVVPPGEDHLAAFSEYFDKLPPLFKRTMEERVIRIYLVKDMDGAGMADWTMSIDDEIYIVLLLNEKTFRTSLQDWISYRESSAYGDTETIKVSSESNHSALLYLLIHEAAHIVDYVHRINTFVEPFLGQYYQLEDIPSKKFENYWSAYNTPTKIEGVPNNFSFYGMSEETLDSSKAPTYLSKLKASPYPSMYGTKNWAEDFAELATFYLLEKNYNAVYTFSSGDVSYKPHKNPLVKARYDLIKKVLAEEFN